MSNIKLTPEQTKELYFEETLFLEQDAQTLDVVEQESWDADGKIQGKRVYVQHFPSCKFYCFFIYRSGSPFTDYHYSWDDDEGAELYEVKKVVKTIESWEVVK